jgi:hypothetical protein
VDIGCTPERIHVAAQVAGYAAGVADQPDLPTGNQVQALVEQDVNTA